MAIRQRRMLGFVIPAIALAMLLLVPRPASRISEANASQVRKGMSRSEVEAILGPARSETRRKLLAPLRYGSFLDTYAYELQLVTDDLLVSVFFVDDETVESVIVDHPVLDKESMWDRFLSFVRRD